MTMFNNIIDSLFGIDILLTFVSATQDEDFFIVDDHKVLACNYLNGWFFIDLIAIVPF